MDCLYGEAQAWGPYLRMVDTALVAVSDDSARIGGRRAGRIQDVGATDAGTFDGLSRHQITSREMSWTIWRL